MQQVLLSSDVTTWLSQSLGRQVEARDLDWTYAFQHALNARRELTRQGVQRMAPPEHVLWHIEFYDKPGERVLDRPLARKIYASAPLYSKAPTAGAVAYNAMLYVREDCRH